MRTIAFVVCLLLTEIMVILGCPCTIPPFLHAQNEFCQRDFTIKVMITGSGNVFNERRYSVRIIRVYNAVDDYKNAAKDHIWSPLGESFCEAKLDVKQTYILSGSVNGNTLRVTSCNWFERFSKKQEWNILKNFKPNCGCPVTPGTPVLILGKFCQLWGSQFECGKLTYCKIDGDYCRFHRSRAFDECMNGIIVPIGKK